MAQPPMLELVTGSRDLLEDKLVRALFSPDPERQIPVLLAQLERKGELHLVAREPSDFPGADLS